MPKPSAKESAKEWTILAYIAGAENLGPAARDGLLQMKQIGSTKNFNLIAQFDAGREGRTTRYYFPPLGEHESQHVADARKVIGILYEASPEELSVLHKLLSREQERRAGQPSEVERPFVETLDEEVKIAGKNYSAGMLFDAVLPGRDVRRSFLQKYKAAAAGVNFAVDPYAVIPIMFDCLFEGDRMSDPVTTSAGDPKVLREFLEWGIGSYPSIHKFVVIKGHGDGMSVAWDATEELNSDDSSLDRLRSVELKEAFTIPQKDQPGSLEWFDIVGFNSCLMGMIEVYHKLKDLVGLGIASEGPTPLQSWPFVVVLRELEKQPHMTPRELARTILDEYLREQKDSGFEAMCQRRVEQGKSYPWECSIDLSVCNLQEVQKVVDQIDDLSQVLRKVLRERRRKPDAARRLDEAREKSQSFSKDGDHVDLSHFCELLQGITDRDDVRDACGQLIQSIGSMVLDQGHLERAKNSRGLSIYFPKERVLRKYGRSLQIKDIHWTEFLNEYVQFRKEGV